jgi:hypothetical protein
MSTLVFRRHARLELTASLAACLLQSVGFAGAIESKAYNDDGH